MNDDADKVYLNLINKILFFQSATLVIEFKKDCLATQLDN